MSQTPETFETDAGLLAGYGCSERGPFLIIDSLDAVPWRRYLFSPRERTFTLEATGRRHCTGRHDLVTGTSLPCPVRATLGEGALDQCSACFVVTGFNPAFYNAAQISEPQRRRNRLPHLVYLAYFGPGILKVGMTLATRGLGRLLEQGARLGAVIATCEDAERARDLEEYVARHHPIAESVRTARKRQLFGAPIDWDAAELELTHAIAAIGQSRPEVDVTTEILRLDSFYGGAHLHGASATDLSDTEPLAISGHCLGMLGDLLVSVQGGQRYLLSVSAMVGHSIRLSAQERTNRFTGQLGFSF